MQELLLDNVPLHKLANFSFKDVAAACKSFIENAGASECRNSSNF